MLLIKVWLIKKGKPFSWTKIFVKGYGFFSFSRNLSRNKNKNLSGKYSQKLLDHSKQSATDALKSASKRAIQKTAEATGDIKLGKLQNLYQRIIQKQIKKENLRKFFYFQN